jgi:probable O-glycosylation ligase (exosortase A-associated)
MRDLAFALVLLGLLPLAAARPFVGVLLWSWVSFMNPHQTLWGFAVSMPWAMLIFFTTILGCFFAQEPRRPAINAITALLVLFLMCITATSFAALGPPPRVWEKWEWAAKIILGLLLTAALLTDRRRIHAFVWVMVIALGYYGVRGGLFTIVTGGSHIVLGPPASIIGDRNHLAAALLITIPLMNYLRLNSRHRMVRLGLMVAMGLSLFSVVGSQSRGALIGLVATAFVFWLRSRGKIISGILMAAGVAAAITFMPDSWRTRMDTIETYQEDASAMGRVTIWLASFELARAYPWTGGGFLAMYNQSIVDLVAPGVTARAAHSIWLEVLGEHGFPTFFVWFSIILAGLLYSMRITALSRGRPDLRWASDLARMSQASIVAYVSAGTFLSLGYWDFFWALMVVLAATHAVVIVAIREQLPERSGDAKKRGRRQQLMPAAAKTAVSRLSEGAVRP